MNIALRTAKKTRLLAQLGVGDKFSLLDRDKVFMCVGNFCAGDVVGYTNLSTGNYFASGYFGDITVALVDVQDTTATYILEGE